MWEEGYRLGPLGGVLGGSVSRGTDGRQQGGSGGIVVCWWRGGRQALCRRGRGCYLSGIDARNPFTLPISSSQLMSRGLATTRVGAVVLLAGLGLVLVQVGEV